MKNSKYRTHDSPKFVEPKVIWPPSLTDPSQDISVRNLVDQFVRRGSPKPVQYFGEDIGRLDIIEVERRLRENKEILEASNKKPPVPAAPEPAKPAPAAPAPGSPELDKLRAELTRILPGLQALVK